MSHRSYYESKAYVHTFVYAWCHNHRPRSIDLLDKTAMKYGLGMLLGGGEVLQIRPVTIVPNPASLQM